MPNVPPIPAQSSTAPRPAAPGAGRARLILLQGPALNQGVKDQVQALGSRFSIDRIVEIVESNFQVKISRDQIFAINAEQSAPRKQAAPASDPAKPDDDGPDDHGKPDKESVQTAADAVPEGSFTLAPEPAPSPFSLATETAPTRTGPGQEQDSREPTVAIAPPYEESDAPPTRTGPGPETETVILPAEVRDFVIKRMAHRVSPRMIAAEVLRDFDFEMDLDEIHVCWRDRDDVMAQPGPGPEKASRPRLSDEVKTFIVKRIACYETPSRIAAAVRINFGIAVDRRRVFDYNPKGSRPPAQRWIDLYDATRARFLRETSEIGVAQRIIRLKMLDRFAAMAEDNDQHDKAAKYLQQAARECGGFYEKHRVPQAVPAVAD